ncbi:MAG: hypothetical protein ACRDTR_13700, partial [Rubrobacter sp.]
MARSWRNFFKRNTEGEPDNGSAVATEAPPQVGEEAEHIGDDVPTAEEALAAREEPAPTDVEGVEEALPEPSPIEEAQDAGAVVEGQESAGWFGRLRRGMSRSRESFVGQLNAAVAEFRDVEDEDFWFKVEEILISSDVGVPTTA